MSTLTPAEADRLIAYTAGQLTHALDIVKRADELNTNPDLEVHFMNLRDLIGSSIDRIDKWERAHA